MRDDRSSKAIVGFFGFTSERIDFVPEVNGRSSASRQLIRWCMFVAARASVSTERLI
jgi:hypothetical protein